MTNVFDRSAKKLQRNRAALDPNPHLYDYLKDEVSDLDSSEHLVLTTMQWSLENRVCYCVSVCVRLL